MTPAYRLPNTRAASLASTRRLIALLAVAGFALAGCDRQTQTSRAVRKSATTLNATGNSTAASVDYRQKQLGEAAATVQPHVGTGLPGEGSAAALLAAESQLGMSAGPAAAYGVAERSVLNQYTVLRAHAADWVNFNSSASNAAQFDPSGVIKDLESQAARKAADIQKQLDAKAEIDRKIEALRAAAKEKLDSGREAENASAKARQRASEVSAQEAAKIIEQATGDKKRADALRGQGALLDAQADSLVPESAEAQLMVTQFQNQKANFEKTATELRQRAKTSQDQATEARANAAKAADKVDAAITQIRSQRDGDVQAAFDAALKQYQSALGNIRKAVADPGMTSARVVEGGIHQSIGDLYWSRGQALATYASTLAGLAALEPALPKRETYKTEAAQIREAQMEALKSAREAYESAQSSFQSAKARGEAKERLDRLAEQLGKIASITSGESADALADLAAGRMPPKPAEGADAGQPAPETAAAPAADPKALVIAAVEAIANALKASDSQALSALFIIPNPALQPMFDSSLRLQGTIRQIDAECQQRFGSKFSDLLKQLGGGAGAGGGLDEFENVKAADLDVSVTGDTAVVTPKAGGNPLKFQNVGGTWKAVFELPANVPPEQLAQAQAMMPALESAFSGLLADIKEGKFQSLQAVQVGMMQRIQQAMTAGGAGGPGGG